MNNTKQTLNSKNKFKVAIFIIIFLFILIFRFSSTNAQGGILVSTANSSGSIPTINSEKNLKTVRVGVYDNGPKVYKDTDGNINGFWADITNYIAKKENWNLTYVYGTWDEGLVRLDKGEIDIMVDVAVTEDRKLKYDFNNETALLSWSIVYTRNGFDISSFKDLEGKKIAIIKSSVHYTAPLGLKNVLTSFGVTSDIIDVTSMENAFKLLDTNKADAGVVNWHYGIANESRFDVNRTGIIFNPSELNYAFKKDGEKNNYLISVIDFDLRELKNNTNSIYYESIKTYFGKSLGVVSVLPGWWNYFLIALGLFIFLVIVCMFLVRQYQKTLKKEIEKGTYDIKKSVEKYSAVVNQAQDGIVIIQDKIIKYANKAISIIGYDDKEIIGRTFIELIAPEEKKRISENYKKRIMGEKVEPVYDTKVIHKNGSIINVEFSSGVIEYDESNAVLVIVRDITERKKTEKRMKELDELKSEFIKVVAHQLRTPLNVIRWSVERLLIGKNLKSEEVVKESMNTVLDADIEVVARIDDLLTALDIEQGKLAYLKKTVFSIESLFNSVMVEEKKKCALKNINFYVEKALPGQLPLIDADSDKVRIIFQKIIDNSITYTKNDGRIDILFKQKDDKIRFEIKDTGIGIPESEHDNIFLRFYRASNAFTMQPDASGLGLFIAKYFVEQNGGHIGYQSKEGEGSTFWFELPIVK